MINSRWEEVSTYLLPYGRCCERNNPVASRRPRVIVVQIMDGADSMHEGDTFG